MLLLASPAAAQDATTLAGERAIRFLAGHGHVADYCEGVLTITPTRVRFDGVTVPRDSFDFQRAEVKDLKYGSAFGLHYVKLRAGGRNWRMALYPDLERRFGDRFALLLRAYRDFDAAYAEVERTAAQRRPASVIELRDDQDGPVLEFPVLAGLGVLWFEGPGGVTIWEGPEADAKAYGEIRSAVGETLYQKGRLRPGLAYGKLEVTATHVRFYREGDESIVIDEDKGQMRLNAAVGGYPRVVANFRRTGRVSLIVGTIDGGLKVYDAA
ncbi:MAG TPA: hypothetical protein VLA96_03270, partial [Terriglobales bacterium]|nr:hypothetical protein [Terriglobales bacterium]